MSLVMFRLWCVLSGGWLALFWLTSTKAEFLSMMPGMLYPPGILLAAGVSLAWIFNGFRL